MRVVTYNVNGMRSAMKKGASSLFASLNAEVVCLQETRAPLEFLQETAAELGYEHQTHTLAHKAGYSGSSILSRWAPDETLNQVGIDWIDVEGRVAAMRFGDLWVVSFYFPSGSSGQVRQIYKYELLDAVTPWLQKLRGRGQKQQVILCGDVNIAHKNADIRNWRGNQKSSGFMPVERGWLSYLFDQLGWVDSFRTREHPEHEYTWWSNRGNARENNVGWRIDYQIVTEGLRDKIANMGIAREEVYSDHAPYWVDYQWRK
ncbi:MAG: exodeoxyribonuclease III [Gammaproteobacteria bacterium]|nr:exodeoxyribonuclease III [Gammaproteobacteria bacterium]